MVVASGTAFSLSVERIVRHMKRGGQTELAKKMKVSPQYLNDLLSGRKQWIDRHKDAVAQYLGMSVADLIQAGEVLHDTGKWFPYHRDVQVLRPQSEDRAEWIVQRAGRDAGLRDVRFLGIVCLKSWWWSNLELYLQGRIAALASMSA